jgi:hypothetical protein
LPASMLNFCTLFDSNYLSRGLALFESLKKVAPNFHLYVVAFDEACCQYLDNHHEPELTIISLADFEDEKLLQIKPGRKPAEYCWTCTPSIILYCIEKFQLSSCTYVDADMIFYLNPQVLLDEMHHASILITEHRYSRDYDVSSTHGKYCVQFMYFKNDEYGMTALRWWRDRCLEWCFDYLEDGKFGDQMYLNDWTERFRGVHVLQHRGGGLAPWNIQQYSLEQKDGKISILDKNRGGRYALVFFHFHGLKFYSDEKVTCSGALYELDGSVKELLYFPYIRRLLEIGDQTIRSGFRRNPHGAQYAAPDRKKIIYSYLKNIIFLGFRGNLSLFKKRLYSIRLHAHIYNLNSIK